MTPINNSNIFGASVWMSQRPLIRDERGSFSRLYDFTKLNETLDSNGKLGFIPININFVQNDLQHTFRGFHFQREPYSESKVITVVQGEIMDYVLDIREGSSTRFKTKAFYITAENRYQLFIPKGFAHAYFTLTPNTTVVYATDCAYHPDYESGVNIFDPTLDINLPAEIASISDKDQNWKMIQKE
jgi:dTDP-4-dehydrorhamnose 3,5-epimerase